MESSPHSISSMRSIISSIENDRHVYRWFLMMISVSEIQRQLSLQSHINKEYQRLKNTQTVVIILYAGIAFIVIGSYVIKQPCFFLGGIIPLAALAGAFKRNRQCVARISEEFLRQNIQPDELNKQTLYQSCEYFARQYNIPSLVDIITRQDFIGRKVLLGSALVLPFIYPFSTWEILLVSLSVLAVTLGLINTSIILRRLK